MLHSRRIFIKRTGSFLLGSGMLVHHSCRDHSVSDVKSLKLDYLGPAEYFKYVQALFAQTRDIEPVLSSFEQSVYSSSQLAYISESVYNKGAKIMMLLEQGKDVLVLPPLAGSLEEFDAIQRQCNLLDRRLAVIDPLRFLPAAKKMKSLITKGETGRISNIDITMNPEYSFPWIPRMEGIAGEGTLLVLLVNDLTSSFPLSLESTMTGTNIQSTEAVDLTFRYHDKTLSYRNLSSHEGWRISFTGGHGRYSMDHSGILQSDSEILVYGDKNAIRESLKESVSDFVDSVRSWKEPESNPVQGMMHILINRSFEEFQSRGGKIPLLDLPV